MKQFMDEDFLLTNETAKTLYHQYAAQMPIIDYHCHINPEEIAKNRKFDNIAQVWLGGDHYKWRLIRSCGVEEKDITGSESTDREKFQKFAEALPRAIGNPMYHWTHLELKKYFGYNGVLNGDTAEEVWNLCNEKLKTDALSVRGIIEQSNVKVIGTTDDPVDSLEWHTAIQNDPACKVKVVPSFRPDKTINIDKAGFAEYIAKLAQASGVAIQKFDDIRKALSLRLDLFGSLGCKASDHGLDYVMCRPAGDAVLDKILAKGLAGEPLTVEEAEQYKTGVLLFLGREYAKRGWVMQIHYGAIRNSNTKLFDKLGPDTGFDCIANTNCANAIVALMDALQKEDSLPKMVLYSLNPNDNEILGALIGCFQEAPCGKIQHGSAWWFNDTKTGMIAQLTSLANLSVLGNFIGMLTDSRSFLSYTRHEYFRRILCNLIGTWVENGEYPNDMEYLGKMVQDISYNNAKEYFGF